MQHKEAIWWVAIFGTIIGLGCFITLLVSGGMLWGRGNWPWWALLLALLAVLIVSLTGLVVFYEKPQWLADREHKNGQTFEQETSTPDSSDT